MSAQSWEGRWEASGQTHVVPCQRLVLSSENNSDLGQGIPGAVGMNSCHSGQVRILGLDPFSDRAKVRQVLGVQLQDANLHDALTVRELVDLYRSFYPNPLDTERALAMVELQEKARTKFDNLSGGQHSSGSPSP